MGVPSENEREFDAKAVREAERAVESAVGRAVDHATERDAMSDHATKLEINGLRCGYGKKKRNEVVHGVTFSLDVGEFVCIIGPNGCGKTTVCKTLMGLLPAWEGSVTINGESVHAMNDRERARHLAYIPQAHTPPFPFEVADVVLMGRTAYVNQLARVTSQDKEVAYEAMHLLGIDSLAGESYTQLSGGQQQLVLIARALAQQTDILVMDEPTAALDFGNQQLVLSRMKKLSQMGKAVLMVTHDPDHALFCADRVIVMDSGSVLLEGSPQECITADLLWRIYEAKASVVDVEVEPGRTERVCVPLT